MGPSLVLSTQPGHWTIGALVNNQFLMQYFINYNLDKGWYIGTLPSRYGRLEGVEWK
jgi:hypothetical protein